jgi:hypothetical protein
MISVIANICFVATAVLAGIAYGGQLDVLPAQSVAEKGKQLRSAKQEVFDEYRTLLGVQLDSSGQLIRDKFEYRFGDDLINISPDNSFYENLSKAIYDDYGISKECIGNEPPLREIIDSAITASYARNEGIMQAALATAKRGLEQRRIWLESSARSSPKCSSSNDLQKFQLFLKHLLAAIKDAPQEGMRIRREFAEKRDARQREIALAEQTKRNSEEREKLAKVEAANAKKQQGYEQCSKQLGIPLSIAQRFIAFYGGPIELCEYLVALRSAGVSVTYSKNSIGAPYSVMLKKLRDSISFDLVEPNDIAFRDTVLVPVAYSINGDKRGIEQEKDAARLVFNINALLEKK